MTRLKSEKYRGYTVHFKKVSGGVCAWVKLNKYNERTTEKTKQYAFDSIKHIIEFHITSLGRR